MFAKPLIITSSVVVVMSLMIASASGTAKDDAYRLHDLLFNETAGYNRKVMPTERNNATGFDRVKVYMTFSLLALAEMVEKEQKLVTIARLKLSWKDSWLSWDLFEFEVSSILMWQTDIWLPDIIVGNSVTSNVQLGYDRFPVRIDYDGEIFWEPTSIINTSCDIDVIFYPFDTQICNIDFETAMSYNWEVSIFVNKTIAVDLIDFSEDGQWELLGTKAQDQDSYGKTWIRFTLLLKRRRSFYIVNVIVPVVFLSLTGTLVFALPAHSGEKMGVGMTVLLAYAVYLTIVSDHLPSTSLQISLLAVYLGSLLGITAIGVVTSVSIIRLYNRPATEPVGPKVTSFTLSLRRIVCAVKKKEVQCPRKASLPEEENWGVKNTAEPAEPATSKTNAESHPAIDGELMTWQAVADTLDWFLFLIFTTFNILATVGCLVGLVVGPMFYSPSLPTEEHLPGGFFLVM